MEQHDGSLVLVVYAVASFYLVVSVLASALIGCIFGEQAGGACHGHSRCVLARSFCCRTVRSKEPFRVMRYIPATTGRLGVQARYHGDAIA